MTKRFTKYKDSGIEWIGEIPEHWEIEKGKWLFSKMNRPVLSDYEVVTCFRDGQVTLRKNRREEGFTNAIKEIGYQGILKGDLVIHQMDAFAGAIGVSDSDGKATPVYSVCHARDITRVCNYFYAYILRSMAQTGFILSLAKGIRERSTDFRFNDFAQLLLPLPTLPEQEAIAQFLDEKCARIDEAVRIKEKQIELLKEYRQIAIHQAVTKGLNNKVKMKDSGIDWIGEVPEHWQTIPIRRVIKITDGTHDTPQYVEKNENTYPLITSKDFSEGKVSFNECKYISANDHDSIKRRSEVCKGDILMSMIGGNIGKSVIIDSAIEFSVKNVAIFKTKNDRSLAKFLLYYLDSGLLSNQIQIKSRGGAQGFLSLSDIKNLIFFKIPLNEQAQIVAHLETLTAKTDEAIRLKEQQIEQLKQYKNSLINDVVTGKVRVA